jgi:hypothetical protein
MANFVESAPQGSQSMAKAMSIAGMIVAGLVGLMFAVDPILGFPFGGASLLMDIGFVVSAGILAYLSWNAFRDNA